MRVPAGPLITCTSVPVFPSAGASGGLGVSGATPVAVSISAAWRSVKAS